MEIVAAIMSLIVLALGLLTVGQAILDKTDRRDALYKIAIGILLLGVGVYYLVVSSNPVGILLEFAGVAVMIAVSKKENKSKLEDNRAIDTILMLLGAFYIVAGIGGYLLALTVFMQILVGIMGGLFILVGFEDKFSKLMLAGAILLMVAALLPLLL